MQRDNQRGLQLLDLTSLFAVLLPILQVTFIYLPSGIKGVFLQQDKFLGISLVTLLISYISIVAYKSRPWFIYVPPFNKKKMAKYEELQKMANEASAAKNFVAGDQVALGKIDKFLKKLDIEQIKRPFQIDKDNRIGILMVVLFINALLFLILGLSGSRGWLATLQSISYVLMIASSVLVLVIFRDTSNNNKRYNEDIKHSTTRAIDLAIANSCFTPKPQIKFISTNGNGINNNFVRVEFNNDEYEISTDLSATRLFYCVKIEKPLVEQASAGQ